MATTNHTYTVNIAGVLMPRIKREISKLGATTIGQDGTPVYDYLRIKYSDEPLVEAAISSAVRVILSTFTTLCSPDGDNIKFSLPDFPADSIGVLDKATEDYIVFYTCSTFVGGKGTNVQHVFNTCCTDALAMLTQTIFKREIPKVTRE